MRGNCRFVVMGCAGTGAGDGGGGGGDAWGVTR